MYWKYYHRQQKTPEMQKRGAEGAALLHLTDYLPPIPDKFAKFPKTAQDHDHDQKVENEL